MNGGGGSLGGFLVEPNDYLSQSTLEMLAHTHTHTKTIIY